MDRVRNLGVLAFPRFAGQIARTVHTVVPMRLHSVPLVSLTTGVAALAFLAVTAPPTATGSAAARLVAASGPTNAAKVFRWGDSQWHDGFIGPVRRAWSLNRPGQIRNQHGMLTINGGSGGGDVTATLAGYGRTYGRWEARVRAEQFDTGATPYRVVAELIPSRAASYRCGAKSIVLASYKLGADRAHMSIRNGSTQFTYYKRRDLSAGVFHTYAVEVTKTHISWFADTRVLMTERRPAALTGTKFKVRFRLAAAKGVTTNPGRMQMDWVRYYTLDRPNARSIKAPQANRHRYPGAC